MRLSVVTLYYLSLTLFDHNEVKHCHNVIWTNILLKLLKRVARTRMSIMGTKIFQITVKQLSQVLLVLTSNTQITKCTIQ